MEQVWYKMGNVCANQCEGDVVLRSSGAFLGTSEQGCSLAGVSVSCCPTGRLIQVLSHLSLIPQRCLNSFKNSAG